MAENYELLVFFLLLANEESCVWDLKSWNVTWNSSSLSNAVRQRETRVAKGSFQADTQDDFESLLLVATYMLSNKARRASRTQQRKRPIQPVGKDEAPELEWTGGVNACIPQL